MHLLTGCHDISETEYHADPCPQPSLSSSICSILLEKSPLHAWTSHPRLNPDYVQDESGSFDLGSAAHRLVLQNGIGITIISGFENYKKKEAQEMRDAARMQGSVPLLGKQYMQASRMVSCLRKQIYECADAHDAFYGGVAERTLIWREDGDVWCRARPDYMRPNCPGSPIDDYKTTTNASPLAWQRQIFNLGHDVQAAFYRRGYRAVFGVDPGPFRFIVQEDAPPYAVSIVQLGPASTAAAEQKVDVAIRIWRNCMATGKWPAYAARIHYVTAPGWAELQTAERMYSMQCLGILPENSETREWDPRRIMA